jgi:hypothetical protein
MSLFTSTDTKEFETRVATYAELMKAEHLTMDEVIKKKQYIQICSLKLENTNHKYSDLASMLNV